jgi:DNA repair ATPase RecN
MTPQDPHALVAEMDIESIQHAWYKAHQLLGGMEVHQATLDEALTALPRICAALERVTEDRKRYRLALESLTVGGSEYHEDPERCVAHVRERQESQHRAIVKFKRERDDYLKRLDEQAKAWAPLVEQRDQARAAHRTMAESLTKANERADRLTSAADRMAGALQDRKGCSSCPLGGDDCDGCAVLAWRETRGDG